MSTSEWVIVGAGYVGSALAERLVRDGRRVLVTRRDHDQAVELAARFGQIVHARGVTLGGPVEPFPPDAIVVCLAPPGDDPAAEIASVVAASRAASRLVYVSSTAVYAPGGGAWVDESWPTEPTTRAGQARLAAEAALPPTAAILRVAGIWGPGRGMAERMLAGHYRVIGDGTAHVSRIHVDDLVEAIVRAGASTITGPINIADDDPAPIGEVADKVAAELGLPPPPRVPAEAVGAEIAGMLTADRRIANTRMKRELGVVLRYPSVVPRGRPTDEPS